MTDAGNPTDGSTAGPYDAEAEGDIWPDDEFSSLEPDLGWEEMEPAEPEPTSPPVRTGRRHRAQGRRAGNTYLRIALILVVAVLLVVAGAFFWVEHQITPGGHPGAETAVVIPSGASVTGIGKILARDGVVHQGTLFALYVRLKGDGPLLPGTYVLPRNSSYKSAIAALTAGPKLITDSLVVPEGYTVRQIAAAVAALPGLHLSATKFLQAADNGTVRSPYEPPAVDNLEGLLFPATYQVEQGQNEVDVLEKMVGAFDDRASQIGLQAAAAKLGESPYQLVTVASIVEREAKLDSDRGPVASAIYNRLKAGMTLGADSTETYYLRLNDPDLVPTSAELETPGPYNTRLNTGLPPTPISNPGLPSLEAAANPPSTTYLYFVEINRDGELGFASTSAGFTQLQAQCQAANLC